jgi:hypothetical protein
MIADQIAVEQGTVETALGRFLQDRPGKLLALVIVESDRAYHRFGELVRATGKVVLSCRRSQVERH